VTEQEAVVQAAKRSFTKTAGTMMKTQLITTLILLWNQNSMRRLRYSSQRSQDGPTKTGEVLLVSYAKRPADVTHLCGVQDYVSLTTALHKTDEK
jgi:hypothetical protein